MSGGRVAMARREWAVVIVSSLTLISTAWLLGGMRVWGLHTYLGGAGLTFLLSIIPMPARWNGLTGEHGNQQNILRLVKFPFFWLSSLFLIYVMIQGLNPRIEMLRGTYITWAEAVDRYIAWLPGSVKADYSEMNPFRVMASFAAAYMLCWGIWVGVRRRSSVLIILWSLVLSGSAMALVGMLQKFTGTDLILWRMESVNPRFWGTFIYRNHGVAYLCVIMMASAVLYFYHIGRSERRGESGGPHLMLFVLIGFVAASIGLALSRGGILFGGLFYIGFILLAAFRLLFLRTHGMSLATALVVLAVLLSCAYATIQLIDFEAIEKRFGDVEETIKNADEDMRAQLTRVTWRMSQERMWMGAGAGSWRYYFPKFQREYPDLYYLGWNPRGGKGPAYKSFHYAHNDILQFFYEFGLVGCGLLLIGFAYWFYVLCKHSTDHALSVIVVAMGFVIACGHAFLDFIFSNPSYWVALNVVICLTAKLLTLHCERHYKS